MAKKRAVLISIIDVIVVFGQRNIALRGNWYKELEKEDVSFQFFIAWKSSFDNILKAIWRRLRNKLIHCREIEIREQLRDN